MSYIIQKPSAYLFTEPFVGSPVADEVLFGMECKILDEKQGFFKVETFYGYRGYINKDNIIKGEMQEYIVCMNFADLLPTPEFKLNPYITLSRGARVQRGEQIGDFIEVIVDNKVFYTHHKNIIKYTVVSKNSLRERLVHTAKQYLGAPYRWGGMSHCGIDCSGLTFMSYYLNGYIIYRDADRDKFIDFQEIDIKKAKKGDLFFFPGHIGMYLGEGDFIHSSGGNGKVDINSLDEGSPLYSQYYKENLNVVLGHKIF